MLFASQALICGVYHYCDQHRVGTKLLGPSCSEPNYRASGPKKPRNASFFEGFWHLADHGLAYFVMLQMALLLLGPEDPTLRRATARRAPRACGEPSSKAFVMFSIGFL